MLTLGDDLVIGLNFFGIFLNCCSNSSKDTLEGDFGVGTSEGWFIAFCGWGCFVVIFGAEY